MKRRTFLRNTSALSIPVFLNGIPLHGMTMPKSFASMNGNSDRVLVLIQLNGGNDGLNTLIPIDSYDNLANLRSNIIIPASKLINITDTNAFHPACAGLANLYDNAKLNIIQNVGYPNQNRSHFRSTDIWNSGSAADEYVNTGWVGRYFENDYPGFPDGYPTADCPDPFAMTIGSSISENCQGVSGNYSVAVKNPNNLFELPVGHEGDHDPNTCYGMHLDFIRTSIRQTNAYADRIIDAYDAGGLTQTVYPDSDLATALKTVATLINGGIQTRVFVVEQGGYDTHSSQVEDDDTSTGNHAELLSELSEAIVAFQSDIDSRGLGERVAGMTFSEFGRQIKSNHGEGTDHGSAAPLFVFGNCVKPGIIGDNPDIPAVVQPQMGVPMQHDFRSVYGSVLIDWFEIPQYQVKEIFFDDFQYLPVLNACNLSTSNSNPQTNTENRAVSLFPNPFKNWATVGFSSAKERVKIVLFDAVGREVLLIADQQFNSGEHGVKFEVRGLAAGNYFVRVMGRDWVKVVGGVKV